VTLELPSGHLDPGETPEQAARRELLEETGHEAPVFESLGMLSPTVARNTNQMWCFFADGAKAVAGAQIQPGEVVELVFYKGGLRKLIEEKEFYSAPSYAALCLAIIRGQLKPPY
jgi:ADP-ribose pyrophosphatase